MTPNRLTWNSRIASSADTSSAAPRIPVPALFTSTSIRLPVRPAISATHAETEASEVTSSCTNSNPLGVFLVGFRLVPYTRYPRAASNSADAFPIPEVVPVMRTTTSLE